MVDPPLPTLPTRPAWLSSQEAADLLGVSLATVRRWTNREQLPCWRTPGGQRRFDAGTLEQWLAERQR